MGKRREQLRIYADAGRHAGYPTAVTTLCGVPLDETAEDGDQRPPPACAACAEIARLWDEVDGSAPTSWFHEHRCERCAQRFFPKRRDVRYCGDTCRAMAGHERRNAA